MAVVSVLLVITYLILITPYRFFIKRPKYGWIVHKYRKESLEQMW